jgi:hypothetical protein
MRAPLRAKYGTEQGHPDAFIRHVAALFVEMRTITGNPPDLITEIHHP